MEVVYTGLRRSPAEIAAAAVEEDVDVVGLSVLSGAHLPLTRRVVEELPANGAGDATVIVGGNIPPSDEEAMREIGVAGVFPTGTPFDTIVEFLESTVTT